LKVWLLLSFKGQFCDVPGRSRPRPPPGLGSVLAPHILDTNEVKEKDSDSLKRDVLGPSVWTQQKLASHQKLFWKMGSVAGARGTE